MGLQKHEILKLSLKKYLSGAAGSGKELIIQNCFAGPPGSNRIKVSSRDNRKKILEITRVPVVVSQETEGYFRGMKDVTAIAQSYKLLKNRPNS